MSDTYLVQRGDSATRQRYFRFREALLSFGDVKIAATEDRYVGFVVNNRRFAKIHINQKWLKLFLPHGLGELRDPHQLTRKTKAGYTMQIKDDAAFEDVIAMIRQSFRHFS